MEVTLLYVDGCPSWRIAQRRLTALADEFGFTVTRREVGTTKDAEGIGFRGSPTIMVDGRDVFAEGHEPVGLSCRIYETPGGPAGAPTLEQLHAMLLRLQKESPGRTPHLPA